MIRWARKHPKDAQVIVLGLAWFGLQLAFPSGRYSIVAAFVAGVLVGEAAIRWMVKEAQEAVIELAKITAEWQQWVARITEVERVRRVFENRPQG